MPLPYIQNKPHIYKYRLNNTSRCNEIKMRSYYKARVVCPVWRQIKYEFLDILRN